ncbi:monovalent cation/H(+) antiporter subunit G [Virgibacillus sp. YIM 98842]|uniref:monovalent cation/H(+) antiporter subunit G n=1 Tax=Virgibacillus sp. YIM 98842 TaxID=2663533 RepID=UPI0013DCCA51|nr:monovalent cation/H(+) antiporter subunit G [Virgibacillus sp. YIM 98842]
MTLIEIIISILLLAGGALSIISGIGILRLPDVYSRIHAASKVSTLGAILIMTAVFLYFLLERIFVPKLLLTIFFIFLTAPVAGLMMGRSAYRYGIKLWGKSTEDDLKKYMEIKTKENSK